jgi:hypothetical protein
MIMQNIPDQNSESKCRSNKFRLSLDRWLLAAGFIVLAILILAKSRANIVADSVDYYAILQWVTPAEEEPIVRNQHFAEQRSPGYSLTALIPYGLLSLIVEPFVTTEKIIETRFAPPYPPPRTPPNGAKGEYRPISPPTPMGSELMLIPAQPLLLKNLPFKDFYIPREGSWFQWKLVLALAVTSYLFLFLGMIASAVALHTEYPTFSGYYLVPLTIFASAIFMHNILDTPLYATLTAYGGISLFTLFFVRGYAHQKARDFLIAGIFLGFVVLVRLETGVIAGTLALLLMVRKEWGLVLRLFLGASWALLAWVVFNFAQFGTLFHLGILRGDINILSFNLGYISDSLIHPSSGVIFWSPLLIPGIIGLLLSRTAPLRMMGICSLTLLALYLIKVPIMYQHVGGGLLDIGGIPVTPPPTSAAMRELVRSDINRYLTVLIPFSVLGLRDGIGKVRKCWARV